MTAIIVWFSLFLTFFLWAWRKNLFNSRYGSDEKAAVCFITTVTLGLITFGVAISSPLTWKTEEVKDVKIALINGKYYLVTGGDTNWTLEIWDPNKKTYRTMGYNILGVECYKNYLQ